eukprot:3723672-Prymnesium_polylepis.1
MAPEQRHAVWCVVAAAQHLGRIDVGAHAVDAAPSAALAPPPEAVSTVSRLLGCSAESLWRALCSGAARGGSGAL